MPKPPMKRFEWAWMILGPLAVVSLIYIAGILTTAHGRDLGRFAGTDPEIKAWFDHLSSNKGLCCSDADGTALSDVDWLTHDGHFTVRIDGAWYDVPADAIVNVPNRIGRTMVWPLRYQGVVTIRCFMLGPLS